MRVHEGGVLFDAKFFFYFGFILLLLLLLLLLLFGHNVGSTLVRTIFNPTWNLAFRDVMWRTRQHSTVLHDN